MNREIEFKGFDESCGLWRYGSLLVDGWLTYICQIIQGEIVKWRVNPKSVGEFTGMRDRHGNKVFEGDVVDVYDFTSAYASKYRGVVKMYRGSWCVEYEDSIFDTVFHPMLFFDDFADRKTEVVGNIHNNPELLSTK